MSLRAPDLTGRLIAERYRLDGVLGEGSFGVVYRSYDLRLRRPVAVKVIKPWWADDPTWTERFEREARAAAALTSPGIVQVHDIGDDSDVGVFIVTELVEGTSLDALLESRGRIEPTRAAEIIADVLAALDVAHESGIVHRDVKPQNVLVADSGRVKLADFGIAHLAAATAATSVTAHRVLGTPVYMSPEQAQGQRVSGAADIYSTGVLLYELLAGKPPFTGESHVAIALQHLNDVPPPLPPDVPAPPCSIVNRALSKNPSARYASAAEMARDLQSWARGPDQATTVDLAAGDTRPLTTVRHRSQRNRVKPWMVGRLS